MYDFLIGLCISNSVLLSACMSFYIIEQIERRRTKK